MARYSEDDIVTYYFVVKKDGGENVIKGWTDKKQYAKFYMEFHNCPKFHLKELTKSMYEFKEIFQENYHDEIKMANIMTRDRDHDSHKMIMISVPMTDTEVTFISAESNTFMSSKVNYGYLNGAIPYMKKKYQKALATLGLESIINSAVHNKRDKFNSQVELDQLLVLLYSFPDDFG